MPVKWDDALEKKLLLECIRQGELKISKDVLRKVAEAWGEQFTVISLERKLQKLQAQAGKPIEEHEIKEVGSGGGKKKRKAVDTEDSGTTTPSKKKNKKDKKGGEGMVVKCEKASSGDEV